VTPLQESYFEILALAASKFVVPNSGVRAEARGLLQAARIMQRREPTLPEPTGLEQEAVACLADYPTAQSWSDLIQQRLSPLVRLQKDWSESASRLRADAGSTEEPISPPF